MSHGVADEEHDGEFGESGDGSRGAHFFEFLDAEFKSEGEHEEDDADVAPDVDVGGVGHGGEPGEVGTDEEAGEDVTQYEGLFQPFENDGDDACGDQNHRKVHEYCGQAFHNSGNGRVRVLLYAGEIVF